MSAAAGKKMLEQATWAIVGSHGRNPICDKLHAKLLRGNKRVFLVNPGVKQTGEVFDSLTTIGQPVDVVDLVINPVKGLAVVEEMSKLGIKNLFIQPGAESQDIRNLAQKNGITVYEGCVLVDARF